MDENINLFEVCGAPLSSPDFFVRLNKRMILKTHKIEAERLRIALMSGYEKTKTAIAWADAIIQEQNNPDYLFIEISLANSKNIKEIISLLGKVGKKIDHHDALRCLLGRVSYLESVEGFNLRDFATWLYSSESNGWELPQDLNSIWSTDDEYSLAEDGVYGDTETVATEFINNLKQFESEQSASPDWYSAPLHTIR